MPLFFCPAMPWNGFVSAKYLQANAQTKRPG